MTYQGDGQTGGHDDRTRDEQAGQHNSGVHLQASGNQSVTGGVIAGRDVHQDNSYHDNSRRKTRLGLGGLALLVVLGGGGYGGYHVYRNSLTGTVSQSGLSGATHTATRLRQAELDQNADDWCFLASANSSTTCRTLMANSFGAPSNCRGQVAQVSLGNATGNDNAAQVPIRFRGRQIGVVPMSWNGSRWQLNGIVYALAVNNGGLLMSAVESTTGGSALLGVASCG